MGAASANPPSPPSHALLREIAVQPGQPAVSQSTSQPGGRFRGRGGKSVNSRPHGIGVSWDWLGSAPVSGWRGCHSAQAEWWPAVTPSQPGAQQNVCVNTDGRPSMPSARPRGRWVTRTGLLSLPPFCKAPRQKQPHGFAERAGCQPYLPP